MREHAVILDPSAPAAEPTANATTLPADFRGKIVGFVDNTKPNFDLLADDMAELLLTEYGAAGIVRHRKRAPSCGATEAMLHELEEKCDLVIAGSGD